jgi:hypothetical protein
LDFRLFEFYGSPKGKKGGGIRGYRINVFKFGGGWKIYEKVMESLKRGVEKLAKMFSPEEYSVEVGIAPLTIGVEMPKITGEVVWK